MARLSLLMESIAELRLEWVDPVQGASPLPAAPPQPLASDALALVRRYTEMMPVVMADGWVPLRST